MTLIPMQRIAQLVAPAIPTATVTEAPPQILRVALVIGYDENTNGMLDSSEGLRDISVRMVESGTNRISVETLTNTQGFAQLEAETSNPVQLIVPYFGQLWTVRSGGQQSFSLLIPPGNQPGLIP